MKKKPGIHQMLLLMLTSLFILGWADSIERIQAEAGGITSVRAAFIQKKHMKILAKPLISKGVLYFKRPQSIRWEYLSPVKSVLLMHNGRIRRFIEGRDGMVEDTGAALQIMQFVLREISFWLNGDFTHSPHFQPILTSRRTIELTPKDDAFSRVIQRIELNLSDTPGVIDRVTIHEGSESYTEYTFTETRLDIPIDDGLFRDM